VRALYLSILAGFAIGGSAAAHSNPRKLTANEKREVEAACQLRAGALEAGFTAADLKDSSAKSACVSAEAKKRNAIVGFISTPADPDK
jgi:hypothetical protein